MKVRIDINETMPFEIGRGHDLWRTANIRLK